MTETMDRRSFLKVMGLAAAAAGTAVAAKSAPALAAEGGPSRPTAILADLSKCDGCAGQGTPACVLACRREHADDFPRVEGEVPINYPTGKNEDWRDRKDVTTTLTPFNWTFVQKAEVDGVEVNIPRHCMHCDNPPCATLCPFGVIEKKASGAVCIDEEHCFGGAKCRSVCPWGIPQRQGGVGLYMDILPGYAGGGVVYKCDLCADRIEQGKLPACVEACSARKGADAPLSFGPREEIRARARELARATGGHLYGDTENGGTGMVYVSPVPFDKVDAALKRNQKERFLFPADPDPMRSPRNVAVAAVVAPVAGVAAAIIAGKKAVSAALGGPKKLEERKSETEKTETEKPEAEKEVE